MIIAEQKIKLKGFVPYVAIVRNGIIVREYTQKQPNLILESAKTAILNGTNSLIKYFTYAHVGTNNTTPNSAQTGLLALAKTTASKYTGSGACGTNFDTSTGVLSYFITFDFSAETGAVTYYEFAIGTGTGATSALNRLLFSTPIAMSSGDQLRVKYQLDIQLTPYTVQSSNPAITNWDSSGDNRLNIVAPTNSIAFQTAPIGFIDTSGGILDHSSNIYSLFMFMGLNQRYYDVNGSSRISNGNLWAWGSTPVSSWSSFGTRVTWTLGTNATNNPTLSWGSYSAGQGYIDCTWTFAPNTWTTDVNIAFLEIDGLLLRFNATQPKATTHRLQIVRRYSLS